MRLALLLPLLLAACAMPRPSPAPGAIAVSATPIPLNPDDPAQLGVGKLAYRGGLTLSSRDPRFGGLSGLRWHDGALYAVSDNGDFFRIAVHEAGGRLTGVGEVRVRRLRGLDGAPIASKAEGDAEALNFPYDLECDCPAEAVDIAFEGTHRVWRYFLVDGWPSGIPSEAGTPASRAWLAGQPRNGGVEAMAGNSSVLIWLSEEKRAPNGAARAWLFHNGLQNDAPAQRQAEISVSMPVGFNPTDLDEVGFERYLVLGRHFSRADGVAATVSAVDLSADGEVVRADATLLARFAPPLNIDNMEGLAVRREGGRTFVYLVSDDNFSAAQRTLLLKFELVD